MSLSTDYLTTSKTPEVTQIGAADIDLAYLNKEARAVLAFWFNPDHEPYWFLQDDGFDEQIRGQFSNIWQSAIRGECEIWRRSDDNDTLVNLAGRLAEIIVIDQFSRNLCRGRAQAFAHDPMALVLAQEAIHQPRFHNLPMQWRKFMILPMMHSESLMIHKRYLHLFEQLDDSETLDFEHRHADILRNFGRYPHRNKALNRESTATELEFLQQPDSSF